MHHGTWINAGTERPRFPFIGIQIKLNIQKSLELFELFITSELAEFKSRETHRYENSLSVTIQKSTCKPNSEGSKHIMLR